MLLVRDELVRDELSVELVLHAATNLVANKFATAR